MLADEAFALHFLEDIFAAGHVAGTWGDVSQRKGTHDYYNENGLEVRTWQGGANTVVLMGDAHMRPEDAERAAEAVRLSLEQVLDTAAGRAREMNLPYTPAAPAEPEAFDVCKNDSLDAWSAGREATPEAVQLGVEVLLLTPVPSLGEGLGAMPRFRVGIRRLHRRGRLARRALSWMAASPALKAAMASWRGGPVAATRVWTRWRARRRGRRARLFFLGL